PAPADASANMTARPSRQRAHRVQSREPMRERSHHGPARAIRPGRWSAAMSLAAGLVVGASATGPVFGAGPPGTSGLPRGHGDAVSPDRHLPETMAPGVAFLDYNGDGWMDRYMVNSGPADIFTPKEPLKNALYRNNGDGTFTDVTDEAGVPGGTFAM